MYNTVVYVMMAFIFWCESKAQKSSHPVAKNYEQRDCFFFFTDYFNKIWFKNF